MERKPQVLLYIAVSNNISFVISVQLSSVQNAICLSFSQTLIYRPWIYNFCGSDILKTLKRLVTTAKCFSEKLTFLKTRENLEIYLPRNAFLVTLQTPSLQLCQKNEPHNWYFSSYSSTSKEPLRQSRSQSKKSQFWNWIDVMLINVSCSLFSAVAVCMLKWLMDGQSFTKKEELFD